MIFIPPKTLTKLSTMSPSALPNKREDSTQNGSSQDLNASNLEINLSQTLKRVPEPGTPELWAQNICSDHMVTARWTEEHGWETPRIQPFGNISLSPAASCLHYATQCFEGMKVFRGHDDKLRLFRPDKNMKRLAMSAKRVSLPEFNENEAVELIKALVRIDGPRWLPKGRKGNFLYIRPALIGSGTQIGIQIPKEALLMVMMVAWPDFSSDIPPGVLEKPQGLRLMTSENGAVRAWPGGFGHAKVGANYGPSFLALQNCRKRGYDQILWVLGDDAQVTEAGSSNFFVVVKNKETGKRELITPPLEDGIILEGVTRQSTLELAREHFSNELAVKEDRFTMYDLKLAWEEERIQEAFVTGTAFFITPVSKIHFDGKEWDIPVNMTNGGFSVARSIKSLLEGIMYGPRSHEWGILVEEVS
ncbi:hypothetical protein CkaCkLH20_09409 [Colletotrichum karsti]|uniref:Branched-chain-amino-acid aminotransferase n=1 Tax=Colletotrichum karsti TaxID=1095194 RepID=A0A9P6I3D3_9PEZI|nr:uncharacterized protein CkaCkLH20_09409 [Colletotrichum karsti]KAF9873246.1 hypothetical protein CkaCkLH20_09409 [Colletotrichum karsti]